MALIPPGVLWASCLCGLVWTLTWGIIPNIPATPHLSPLSVIPWYVSYACGSGYRSSWRLLSLFFFPFSLGGFYPRSLKLGPLSCVQSNKAVRGGPHFCDNCWSLAPLVFLQSSPSLMSLLVLAQSASLITARSIFTTVGLHSWSDHSSTPAASASEAALSLPTVFLAIRYGCIFFLIAKHNGPCTQSCCAQAFVEVAASCVEKPSI